MLWLGVVSVASAGGLDLLEVGGLWGSPGATNPTAVWWNPAGLAVGGGTQILVEGAPTFATVNVTRDNPDYGTIDPENAIDADGDGVPDLEYDYSGSEKLKFTGVVPFAGVQSDFGVKGFSAGAALYVPFAKSGTSDQEWSPGRYALRDGGSQAVYTSLAVAYRFKELVAFGLSGSYVDSTWEVNVDTEYYTALGPAIAEDERIPGEGVPPTFQDGYVENRGYTVTLDFDPLKARAFTFGGGVYLTPSPKVGISLAYQHGVRLDHSGGVGLSFQCPPTDDGISALAAGIVGLCQDGQGTKARGQSNIGYNLPGRINGGLVLSPNEKLRLEAMGGLVFWKVFTDYEINTRVTDPSQFPALTPEDAEETAQLVSQDRLWARDSRNSGWFAVDGKAQAHKLLVVGGRFLVDSPAVPTQALSTNNFDAWALAPSVMVALTPFDKLDIGLTYGHMFWLKRTTTDSVYGLSVDPEKAKPDRYFYPSANGTYQGRLDRVALSVRGKFGGPRLP